MSVGALWASLPGACEYLPEGDRWLRPLHAVPREPGAHPAFDFTRLSADLIGVRGKTQEEARVELGDYPLAVGADLPTVQNVFVREMTPLVRACWLAGLSTPRAIGTGSEPAISSCRSSRLPATAGCGPL